MEQAIERFLALSRRYLLEEKDAGPRPEPESQSEWR